MLHARFWQNWASLAALGTLTVLIAVLIITKQPATPRAAHLTITPAHSKDISLPPMLEIQTSATDPDLIKVTVLPEVVGQAQLKVNSNARTNWTDSRASQRMTLKKGHDREAFSLRVQPLKGNKTRKVKIDLELEDDHGNPMVSVSREVTLGQPESSSGNATPTPMQACANAYGQPLVARVPANAPAPQFGEGR